MLFVTILMQISSLKKILDMIIKYKYIKSVFFSGIPSLIVLIRDELKF